MDWRLLKKTAQGSSVVVTAIPKSIINGIKDSLLIAGLWPLSIEPSVTALARLVPPTLTTPVLVVELDTSGSSATIVDGGVSQVTATSFYQSTQPPAEKVAVVAKSMAELIHHWHEDHHDTSLTVFITGEMADESLRAALSQAVNLPCTPLPVNQVAEPYHAAYAAAISAINPPESDQTINLVPPGLQQYYGASLLHQSVSRISTLALSLLVVSLALVGLGFAAIHLLGAQKLAAVAHLAKPANQPALSNLDTLTKNAIRYNRLYKRKITPEMIITSTYQALPATTLVTELSYEPEKRRLHLVGKTPDRETIIQVSNELKKTGLFEAADMPLSLLNTSATGDFSFDLKVKKL
jgi:hypothetical protein